VRVLHSLSEKENLPWHRIIRADGSIALRPSGGLELQSALLRSEGVEVSEDGRVDMGKYRPVALKKRTDRMGKLRKNYGSTC
jgi:methylated-DNA-protein-cysteine methyltransferase-like protein